MYVDIQFSRTCNGQNVFEYIRVSKQLHFIIYLDCVLSKLPLQENKIFSHIQHNLTLVRDYILSCKYTTFRNIYVYKKFSLFTHKCTVLRQDYKLTQKSSLMPQVPISELYSQNVQHNVILLSNQRRRLENKMIQRLKEPANNWPYELNLLPET